MARRRADVELPAEARSAETGWAHYVGDDPALLQIVGMCPNREKTHGKRCGRTDVTHLWYTPPVERLIQNARIWASIRGDNPKPQVEV